MSQGIQAALASYRTTIIGLVVLAAAITEALARIAGAEDVPPATLPDWARLAAEFAIGPGFVVARDNRVSSEKAGAE